MKSTQDRTAAQKSGRLYTMVGLLVLLLAFVAVTFYLLTRESRNQQEWIRLSTDLQVHSQQLAKSAAEAVEGNRSAFLQLGDSTGTMTDAVDALKDGDPLRALESGIAHGLWLPGLPVVALQLQVADGLAEAGAALVAYR